MIHSLRSALRRLGIALGGVGGARLVTGALAVSALAVGVAQTGCATIVHGSEQTLSIDSSVRGAEVVLDGEVIGLTPLSRRMDRRSYDGVVVVRKEGYIQQTLNLKSELNLAFWGNVISFGASFFGSTTDAVTGAMYEYAPSNLYADLQPITQTPTEHQRWAKATRLRAFVLLNHDALIRELAEGQGVYVDTLMRLLAVPAEGRDEALSDLRRRWATASTLVEFAEQVATTDPA